MNSLRGFFTFEASRSGGNLAAVDDFRTMLSSALTATAGRIDGEPGLMSSKLSSINDRAVDRFYRTRAHFK